MTTQLPDDMINLDRVCDLVIAAGHDATVDMTGGGIATLFAGPMHTDEYGDRRAAVACGPGTYMHRDYGFSTVWTDDLYVGIDADDPAEDDFDYVAITADTEEGRAAALAAIIIARLEA